MLGTEVLPRAALRRLYIAIAVLVVMAMFACAGTADGAIGWQSTPDGSGEFFGAAIAVTSAGDTIVAHRDGGLVVQITPKVGLQSAARLAPEVMGTPTIVADQAGGAYVAWNDLAGSHVTYRPAGGAFGTPADFGASDGAPALAGDASGDVAVAFWQPTSADATKDILVVARRPAGGGWGALTRVSGSGSRAFAYVSLAMAGDGRLFFAYVNDEPVASTYITTATLAADGTISAPQEIQGGYSTPQIAVDGRGRAIVVWDDGSAWYATAPSDGQFGAPVPLGHHAQSTTQGDGSVKVLIAATGRVLITVRDVDFPPPGDHSHPLLGVSATLGDLGAPLPPLQTIISAHTDEPVAAFDADGRAIVAFGDGATTADPFSHGAPEAVIAEPGQPFGAPHIMSCAIPWQFPIAAAGGASGDFEMLLLPLGPSVPAPLTLARAITVPTENACSYGIVVPALGSPDHLVLDASSMVGPDELDARVQWTFTDADGAVTNGGLTDPIINAWPHPRGRYLITASVSHTGWSDTRQTNLLIDDPPAVNVAVAPQRGQVGAPLHVSVSATPLPGGTVTSTAVDVMGAPAASFKVDGTQVTFNAPGTYRIRGTAIDDLGVQGSATTTVTIDPAAHPPSQPSRPSKALPPCMTTSARSRMTARGAARAGIPVTLHVRATPCAATISVHAGTSRRLGRVVIHPSSTGTRTVLVRLNQAARRWMKKHKHISVTVDVRIATTHSRTHITLTGS